MQLTESSPQLLPSIPRMTVAELSRAQQENRRRFGGRGQQWCTALALLVTVLLVGGHCFLFQIPFESSRWKASSPAFRSRMVNDLVSHGIFFRGLTSRGAVTDQLGPPDAFSEQGELVYSVAVSPVDRSALVVSDGGRVKLVIAVPSGM